MTDDRYSRHVFLKEIGAEGQSRIAASRVFVIGAGGVGCPAALALVESGIASLTIADADAVDLSNLPRQILHTPDRIGMNKAQSAAIALRTVNPAVPVNVVTDYVDEEKLTALARDCDIIIDGNINYFLNRNGERLDLTPSAKGTLQQRENIVDGVRSNLSPRVRAVVGADAIYAEVSAASILAKVERDAYMTELAESYPGYGFEKHVGYGTAAHVAALAKLGPIRGIHRYSYAPIKKLLDPVS